MVSKENPKILGAHRLLKFTNLLFVSNSYHVSIPGRVETKT